MNNQELLFNLLKKRDSGEIKIVVNGAGAVFLREKGSAQSVYLVQVKEKNLDFDEQEAEMYYEKEYNEPFKKNFYQEKGLDKCWVKDCPNKIYQTENDYKKVKIPCQEAHTRMLCLECSKKHE